MGESKWAGLTRAARAVLLTSSMLLKRPGGKKTKKK